MQYKLDDVFDNPMLDDKNYYDTLTHNIYSNSKTKVNEKNYDNNRHGKGLEGLLKRYFK